MTKHLADHADHGATGPANLRRPSHMVETIAAGVTAKRYDDATLLDYLYRTGQLAQADEGRGAAERRLAAGEWFAIVHRRAFPPKSVTASYGQIRGVSAEGDDPDLPEKLAVLSATDPNARNLMDSVVWNRAALRDAERAVGTIVLRRTRRLIVDQELTVHIRCVQGDLDSIARHRGIS